MKIVVLVVFLALAILSLRGIRWAYITFIVLGLLYFPASVGFQITPKPCEITFSLALGIFSLTNYGHIVRFAIFFAMSKIQIRTPGWKPFIFAAAATIVMGALVEIAEAVSGNGQCRSRDLIPDAAGGFVGFIIVLVWNKIRRRPVLS